MISNQRLMIRLAFVGGLVSLTAVPPFAFADAEHALRQFIHSAPELRASFDGVIVTGLSPVRAEASVTIDQQRHAVVLFKENINGDLGQQFCHAALGAVERALWLRQLSTVKNSDGRTGELIAAVHAVRFVLRHVEYHSIKGPIGWNAGVCVVNLSDLATAFTASSDWKRGSAKIYLLGKQLYSTGHFTSALDHFKSLRLDEKNYPNALLFIVAILDKENLSIADALRSKHVDMQKVTDVDALEAYIKSSVERKLLKDARVAGTRCLALNAQCSH